MIPVSKFAEKDKFCMATYTPYVDMAVEIGDLFSQVTGNSWTDTDLWEGSTLGVNIAAWGSLISAALYFWRRLEATRKEAFGAMDPHRNDAENPPART